MIMPNRGERETDHIIAKMMLRGWELIDWGFNTAWIRDIRPGERLEPTKYQGRDVTWAFTAREALAIDDVCAMRHTTSNLAR